MRRLLVALLLVLTSNLAAGQAMLPQSSSFIANAYSAEETAATGTVSSVVCGTGLSGGTITDTGTCAVLYGSSASTAAQGNDSRLSDARTPSAHATSHKNGGADEVATATSAANAIPKAGAGGKLALAWLSAVMACANLTDAGTGCAATLAAIATSGSASDLITGTVPAARLPNPSSSTLGGVQSKAAVSNEFLTAISTSGVPASAQPGFTNLSGSAACSQMPALTGDTTSSAGTCAMTVAKIGTTGASVTFNTAAAPAYIGMLPMTTSTTSAAWFGVNGFVAGRIIGADMNSTADQAISISVPGSVKYIVNSITCSNASASLTTAVGGIYDATSKGGTAWVANTQTWTALSTSTKYLILTKSATLASQTFTASTVYLSLTTAQGTAATADCYVAVLPLP